MRKATSNRFFSDGGAADLFVPLIRVAATVGFAIAPCSLGFVIIAVSEHLIRSIMVGDDPELLVSNLQNQFPTESLAIMSEDPDGIMARVVEAIERPVEDLEPLLDVAGLDFQSRVRDALQNASGGLPLNYTFLAEQLQARVSR